MAKRVISGPLFNESWVELDNEIHDFESSVMKDNQRQPVVLQYHFQTLFTHIPPILFKITTSEQNSGWAFSQSLLLSCCLTEC